MTQQLSLVGSLGFLGVAQDMSDGACVLETGLQAGDRCDRLPTAGLVPRTGPANGDRPRSRHSIVLTAGPYYLLPLNRARQVGEAAKCAVRTACAPAVISTPIQTPTRLRVWCCERHGSHLILVLSEM
jgi:hypothetical protein